MFKGVFSIGMYPYFRFQSITRQVYHSICFLVLANPSANCVSAEYQIELDPAYRTPLFMTKSSSRTASPANVQTNKLLWPVHQIAQCIF